VSGPEETTSLPDGSAGDDEPHSDDASSEAGSGADDGGGDNLAHVSVTVDDEHLASLPEVVAALREHGMQVDDVLAGLGIVTGSTADAALLEEVEGVSGVDTQLEHRIPPPEEEIQ
jgi:hypothetical protein